MGKNKCKTIHFGDHSIDLTYHGKLTNLKYDTNQKVIIYDFFDDSTFICRVQCSVKYIICIMVDFMSSIDKKFSGYLYNKKTKEKEFFEGYFSDVYNFTDKEYETIGLHYIYEMKITKYSINGNVYKFEYLNDKELSDILKLSEETGEYKSILKDSKIDNVPLFIPYDNKNGNIIMHHKEGILYEKTSA